MPGQELREAFDGVTKVVAQILEEEDVRRIAREEAKRPVYVTQRNVEQVIGVPRRTFLRDAKAKRFHAVKEQRLVRARTEEALSYYELALTVRAVPVANDDAEAAAFGRVGARRVAR